MDFQTSRGKFLSIKGKRAISWITTAALKWRDQTNRTMGVVPRLARGSFIYSYDKHCLKDQLEAE